MEKLMWIFINVAVISAEEIASMTEKVWFEIEINGQLAGRIGIGMFTSVVPITTQNFIDLADSPKGEGYTGATFHRIIPNVLIQGGDWVKGDGTVNLSSFNNTFPDENFSLKHYGEGWVSMANSGTDSNGSQFLITLAKVELLDDKHVVFGKVVEGMDVVRKIGRLPVDGDRPRDKVIISAAGVEAIDPPIDIDLSEYTKSSNCFKFLHYFPLILYMLN